MTIRAFSRRRVLTGAAAVSAAAILPRASYGSDWRPTETVRLIVPAAAGGSTDVMGRLLAAHLQTAWGQSAVVENRSGGGGTIGTAEVVRGKADGHVILVGNPGPNAIAYSIFRNMTYKADQLQPVSNMIRIPNIVSAHPSTGIKSIAGTDRLHQGQSGQADLRLLRRRAEPSPHRRLVPAAHRAEDGACAVPRRRSGAAGGAGRRYPDPVRQPLSVAAADPGRQAHRALRSPRRSAARWRRTSRPCARARPSFRSSTSPPGSASSCRRPRPLPSSRRSTRRSRRCWRARTSRPPSARWAQPADWGTPQQFSDFVQAETTKFAEIIKREGLQMDVN